MEAYLRGNDDRWVGATVVAEDRGVWRQMISHPVHHAKKQNADNELSIELYSYVHNSQLVILKGPGQTSNFTCDKLTEHIIFDVWLS